MAKSKERSFLRKYIRRNGSKVRNKFLPSFENQENIESVLVVCAHSDDEIFGPGATLAKFASKGISIHTVILSYGEKSNPLRKKEIIRSIRAKEAIEADKLIGGKGVEFIGLEEGSYWKEYSEKESVRKRLVAIFNEVKPDVIFTHSSDDLHKDHRETLRIVLDTLGHLGDGVFNKKPEVFMFDIWTLFNFKKSKRAEMIVDVSETFAVKIEALKLFKSQKLSLIFLGWSVYLNAIINGWKIKKKYGEAFYKVDSF
ncbi:MAG: hypothetical protein GWP09_01100 [Nitrospiraceae bacterium]|nr:hypothetical protein [Nitrospiraceae bacterium]